MREKTKKIRVGMIHLIPLFVILFISPRMSYAADDAQVIHGFKLIEKRFIKEVDADCYFFEHIKSGARLIKIAAKDANKTFTIGFHTLPNSDCGTAHILEHCSFGGSKNFPIKSMLESISKGSLKTFVNASTGKDRTIYPVASMNEKDYFNLMHLYLDAVFNPLLYTNEKIFMQEGWHYELTGKDAPLEYKGIVYGEMKGAYSSPNRYTNYFVYKNLFTDNEYRFESGGYPYAIPDLSWDAFKNFHKRFYHPNNSHIVLYGDADLDKELAFIDEYYLSNYTRSGEPVICQDQKPFTSMKDIHEYYPAMVGAPTENQTMLSLSFVCGHNTDVKMTEALDILSDVLVNRETAPIRIALQKAGIGKNVSANNSDYQQNVFEITVQNANPSDKEKFYSIVMNTLKEAAEKGVDKKAIESYLNSYEFYLREGDSSQKGRAYAYQVISSSIFTNHPLEALEYETKLADLKNAIKTDYFESLISKEFISNPHALLLTVEPKAGLDKELNAQVEEKLKNYKASLSDQQLDQLIQQTKDLIAYQKSPSTPEALASFPVLSLQDISPKTQYDVAIEKKVGKTTVIHHEDFTNGIVYVNQYYDLRVLPQQMIPYASLLSNVLTSLNTEHYSVDELNKEIDNQTGGINIGLTTYLENYDDTKMIPKFVVVSKALNSKADRLFELTREVIRTSKLEDKELLKTVLTRQLARLDNLMKGVGDVVASARFESYLTNEGSFNETVRGYSYYQFLKDIVQNFDAKSDELIENLRQISLQLFTKDNLMIGETTEAKDYPILTKQLEQFTSKLPTAPTDYQKWSLSPEKKNEGFQTASKVQYVYGGYNLKKLGYQWNGNLRVLNNILSRDWFFKQIRVVGGAYGGRSSIDLNGNIMFVSYRDPNLTETLKNFQNTIDYLKNFKANEKEMTQYIIGTISTIDQPKSISQRAFSAYNNYFTKRTEADVQKDRQDILKTTEQDIRNYAKLIEDVLAQQTICIYGNAEKIESNKDLFKNLIRIE